MFHSLISTPYSWCDWKRLIHHELLEPDQAINLTLCCQQFMQLKPAIKERAEIDRLDRHYHPP